MKTGVVRVFRGVVLIMTVPGERDVWRGFVRVELRQPVISVRQLVMPIKGVFMGLSNIAATTPAGIMIRRKITTIIVQHQRRP